MGSIRGGPSPGSHVPRPAAPHVRRSSGGERVGHRRSPGSSSVHIMRSSCVYVTTSSTTSIVHRVLSSVIMLSTVIHRLLLYMNNNLVHPRTTLISMMNWIPFTISFINRRCSRSVTSLVHIVRFLFHMMRFIFTFRTDNRIRRGSRRNVM